MDVVAQTLFPEAGFQLVKAIRCKDNHLVRGALGGYAANPDLSVAKEFPASSPKIERAGAARFSGLREMSGLNGADLGPFLKL